MSEPPDRATHWERLYRAWARLPVPVRPHPDALAGIKQQIAHLEGRTLLLGATAGLADAGPITIVVEADPAVAHVTWSGPERPPRIVGGDWRALPFAAGAFSASIGDGSLNVLRYPGDVTALLLAVARVLRSGGRFACRVFLTPERGETVAAVAQAAWRGEIGRFQALKFRLAMAVAAEAANPNVAVARIHQAFEACFADRRRLAEVSGWDPREIATIDVYRASLAVYSFPKGRECLAAVPAAFASPRLVPAGSYELAERCPILVADRV